MPWPTVCTPASCCRAVFKAAEAVQIFWHELQSKARLSASGLLLELQDGTFFMGDKLCGSRMIVRSCYHTLYARIKDLHLSGLCRFVVTGALGR